MSLNRSIDHLIKSDRSWVWVVASIWVFFVFSLLLVCARFAINLSSNQLTVLPLGGEHQLRSFQPFDTDGADQTASSAIGMQSVTFVNGRPVMVYLFAPSKLYPTEGYLQLDNSGKDLSWQRVSGQDGIWLSKNFSDVHGIYAGMHMDIGSKQYRVNGVISAHSFVPYGLGAFMPIIILNESELDAAGLLTPASRTDYFYFSNKVDDKVLMRYRDAANVVKTQARSNVSVLQNVTHLYQWLDIFLSLLLTWFCYGLYCAFSHHKTEINSARITAFYLGLSHSMWLQRLRWSIAKYSLIPIVLLFAFAGSMLDTSEVIMFGVIVYLFGVIAVSSYTQAGESSRLISKLAVIFFSIFVVWLGWFQYAFNDLMKMIGYALMFVLFWVLVMSFVFRIFPGLHRLLKGSSRMKLKVFIVGCRLAYGKYRTSSLWLAATLSIFLVVLFSSVTTNLLIVTASKLEGNADNIFMINVLPSQVDALKGKIGQNRPFYPMVKGRLRSINGVPVKLSDYDGWTQSSALKRDLNISYMDHLPEGNALSSGRYPDDGISIEKRLAEKLNVAIGDRLTFDLYGDVVTLPITSLRHVEWRQLSPNFFMIFPRNVLEKYPSSYLSSFFWRAENSSPELMQELASSYPNLSFFFIDEILNMARSWIEVGERYIQLLSIAVGIYTVYMYVLLFLSQRRFQAVDQNKMYVLGMSHRDVRAVWHYEQAGMLATAYVTGYSAAKVIGAAISLSMFGVTGVFFVSSDIPVFILYCLICLVVVWLVDSMSLNKDKGLV